MRCCNWSSKIERILANFRSVARVSKVNNCWLYSWERLERMDSNTSRFSIKREQAADKSPFARLDSMERHPSYTERYLEIEDSKIEVLSRRFWIAWRWFSKSPRCLLLSNYNEWEAKKCYFVLCNCWHTRKFALEFGIFNQNRIGVLTRSIESLITLLDYSLQIDLQIMELSPSIPCSRWLLSPSKSQCPRACLRIPPDCPFCKTKNELCAKSSHLVTIPE